MGLLLPLQMRRDLERAVIIIQSCYRKRTARQKQMSNPTLRKSNAAAHISCATGTSDDIMSQGNAHSTLVRAEMNVYREQLVVPLAAVVKVNPSDTQLFGLKVSEQLASSLRSWQTANQLVLVLLSTEHIKAFNITEFLGTAALKHPSTRLHVAFLPWGDGVNDFDTALSTTSLTMFRGVVRAMYRDNQEGMNWAGDSIDNRYDMFVISVLIQIEEKGNHPLLPPLKRSREDVGSSEGNDDVDVRV